MWAKATTAFRSLRHQAKSMAQDETAVTAIEYALLASLIAIVAVASFAMLGGSLRNLWMLVANAVVGAL